MGTLGSRLETLCGGGGGQHHQRLADKGVSGRIRKAADTADRNDPPAGSGSVSPYGFPDFGRAGGAFQRLCYSSLVEKARLVAKEEKVPLADTNRAMEQMLSGLDQEQKERVLFTDPWHPNPRGHEIYAQQLLELLNPFLLKES